MNTKQASFTEPLDRSKEVLRRLARDYDPETIIIAVSGGTDSTVAADVFARLAPEFGLEPDVVTHYNTGASIPQTRLVAKIIAKKHGLDFVEQGYRNKSDSLAHRVLENGWPGGYAGSPAKGGHGLEWANRKNKAGNAVYMQFDGAQVWVSGARKLESKKRSGNVPDNGIQQDKPRRTWCSIIGGWTSEEKRAYIKEHGLPVSESYLFLGYSGECTACAFDDAGIMTDIEILSPELAHAIRSLALWLYMRVRRGDVDIAPKRLCWGWEPGESMAAPETQSQLDKSVAQSMVGCDEDSCSTRDRPDWVLKLPDEQIVTRSDVKEWWESETIPQRFA